MSESEHLKEVAPFPWKSYKHHPPHLYRLVDAQGLTVLLVPGKENTGTGDRAKEVAQFVLHAVNSHEDALEACRLIIRAYEHVDAAPEALDRAYAAITKAEKGEI